MIPDLTPYQRELIEAHRARQQRFRAAAIRDKPRVVQPMAVRTNKPLVVALEPTEPTPIPDSAIRIGWGRYIPAIERIKREVLKHYPSVTMADLNSGSRVKRVIEPRHLAVYLSRMLTDHSMPAIGRDFGGKDHSCVDNSIHRIQDRMAREPEFAAHVAAIRSRIEGEEIS